jgi:hypothetical protein
LAYRRHRRDSQNACSSKLNSTNFLSRTPVRVGASIVSIAILAMYIAFNVQRVRSSASLAAVRASHAVRRAQYEWQFGGVYRTYTLVVVAFTASIGILFMVAAWRVRRFLVAKQCQCVRLGFQLYMTHVAAATARDSPTIKAANSLTFNVFMSAVFMILEVIMRAIIVNTDDPLVAYWMIMCTFARCTPLFLDIRVSHGSACAVIMIFAVLKTYFQVLAFSVNKQKDEIRASMDRTHVNPTDTRQKSKIEAAVRALPLSDRAARCDACCCR